jgi:hypothetical protein
MKQTKYFPIETMLFLVPQIFYSVNWYTNIKKREQFDVLSKLTFNLVPRLRSVVEKAWVRN